MTARSAATAAGKRATADPRETKRARATGPNAKRPGAIRRTLAPAGPRRVSGPVHGRSAVAAEVAPRIFRPAPPITRPAPRIAPRPVPRPIPRITRPPRRAAPATATRGARALAFVRGLPDHSLTDRLVRGRAWIPVLGVLLVGIVALQVSILRLNASMGRAIEQSTTLQTQNGELRAQVASLGSVARIERIASGMGMVMSTPAQISFLSPHASGLRTRAIANMTAPTTSALGVVQSAASSATSASTVPATLTASGTSTASGTASTTGTSLSSAGATTPPAAGSTTSAPSSPAATGPSAAGTYATGGTAPSTAATNPTGASATQPAAGGVTGAATPAQQSSGGASSTGAGG